MKNLFVLGFLILFLFSFKTEQRKLAKLPKELKEISGLEIASSSSFYAINDGGNDPFIYEINYKGEIFRRIKVLNANNIDWEDICVDDTYRNKLYIGDFGNNKNNRKNLCVYRINLRDVQTKNEVEAEKIPFSYPDQVECPPTKRNRHFDCEAMCIVGSKWLMLFSKNNTKPYNGICSVYRLDLDDGSIKLLSEIKLGKNGYFQNSVTAADFYGTDISNHYYYLSTYSSMYKFTVEGEKFIQKEKIDYKTFSQKESLVVKYINEIYVADERTPLGTGGNLYKIHL